MIKQKFNVISRFKLAHFSGTLTYRNCQLANIKMKHYKNIFVGIFFVLLFVIATLATWVYSQIDSALPQLEGKKTLFGLSATATVERDKAGIVTIKAKNRLDVAVATGFVHAQERFFQMDLLRRNSAGELASLFGKAAIDYDSDIRRHRFRERATTIVKQLPKADSDILKAYTRGVNQGLKYLKAPPFEYLLLQHEPVEWQEEDTILSVLSMYIDLQYQDSKEDELAEIFTDNALTSNTTQITKSIEKLIQIDYVLPIGENSQFEFGHKSTLEDLNSDFDVVQVDPADFDPSNELEFKQNIYAFYTQYGSKINKLSYLLGLRTEITDIDINLLSTNQK